MSWMSQASNHNSKTFKCLTPMRKSHSDAKTLYSSIFFFKKKEKDLQLELSTLMPISPHFHMDHLHILVMLFKEDQSSIL